MTCTSRIGRGFRGPFTALFWCAVVASIVSACSLTQTYEDTVVAPSLAGAAGAAGTPSSLGGSASHLGGSAGAVNAGGHAGTTAGASGTSGQGGGVSAGNGGSAGHGGTSAQAGKAGESGSAGTSAHAGGGAGGESAGTGGESDGGDGGADTQGGSGGDSGGGTTGGDGGDAGGGGGDEGGSAGAPGCNGGSGGAPTQANAGDPCTEQYSLSCAATVDNFTLYCDPTTCTWTIAKMCDTGLLCNDAPGPDQGSCQTPPAACMGQSSGTVVCDGANRETCSNDPFVPVSSTACSDAAHCMAGTGDQCALCLDGEYQCTGAELAQCSTDHLSFVDMTMCSSAGLCNATLGACTAAACTAGQYACTGLTLQVCNADMTGFDDVQTCTGYCDAANARCDVCQANARSCSDSSVVLCAADGQSSTTTPCDSSKPYCDGFGVCVQCVTAGNCQEEDCATVSCTASHTCSYKFHPPCM